MAKRIVSWLETLTKPKVVFKAGQGIKVYVPRQGYVFRLPIDKDGRLGKPRKRDRGQCTIDLYHERCEEPSAQPLPGVFEPAWRQGYAVWEEVKKRGIQGELF